MKNTPPLLLVLTIISVSVLIGTIIYKIAEVSITPKSTDQHKTKIDYQYFSHASVHSNVTRIIDREYGYIIYITREGVTAVPLTDKKQ